MRRITVWALSTVTTLVLLFSYHTSTSSSSVAAGSSVLAQVTHTPTATATSDGAATPNATKTTVSSTYTGSAVDTQYGPVQVRITVTNGKITNAVTVQVPSNDPRDQEINSQAVPILNQEAVSAQSATIDMVSGATFTSHGYIQSLQSAIDQAHL